MAEQPTEGLMSLLPWHERAWTRVQEALAAGRLPHALLLYGPRGIGKSHFAGLLAKSLLCRQPREGGLPCGACEACVLASAGTHPDLRLCELLVDDRTGKEKESIGVDQVREVSAFMSLKPHYGGRKIAIIRPADRLNLSAANALLKTLEEPPEDSLLILEATGAARLPATVLSRCQRLAFAATFGGEARAWLGERLEPGQDPALMLALTAGAPLAALGLGREAGLERRSEMMRQLEGLATGQVGPLEVAESWLKFGGKESLYWLYGCLADMVRLRTTASPPHLGNPDLGDRLGRLASGWEPRVLLNQLRRVGEAMRALEGQANAQLVLEDVLISMSTDK